MNLFQLYKKFSIIESNKKTHYATCVTGFNKNTGNRKHNMGNLPYRDASDLANALSDDNNNNKEELKIKKEDFLKHCIVDDKHKHILNHPTTEFLHEPVRDSHVMYDAVKDVHHFYENV